MSDNIEDIDEDDDPLKLARLHVERARTIIEDESLLSIGGLVLMILLEVADAMLYRMTRSDNDEVDRE